MSDIEKVSWMSESGYSDIELLELLESTIVIFVWTVN